jgi:hypothetical protein
MTGGGTRIVNPAADRNGKVLANGRGPTTDDEFLKTDD